MAVTDTQMDTGIHARNEPQGIRMDLAFDAARIGVWEWDPATGAIICNRHMKSMCGIPANTLVTFDSFIANVCPEDRDHARSSLLQAVQEGGSQSMECRLLNPNAAADRWIVIEGRAYSIPGPAVHVIGTTQDISARKSADAQRDFALRDLEHRMRNVFSVLTSVISLSLRSAATPKQLAAALQARVGALARAHQLLSAADVSGAVPLRQVIEAELGPFTGLSTVTLCGPPVKLGNRQAMAMNCIAHELTTNAVKHGALAHPQGQLFVRWSIEPSLHTDCLVLRWKETCSDEVAAPVRLGLGSKILSVSARLSLRGDISLDFERDGLLATLVVPMPCLTGNAGH